MIFTLYKLVQYGTKCCHTSANLIFITAEIPTHFCNLKYVKETILNILHIYSFKIRFSTLNLTFQKANKQIENFVLLFCCIGCRTITHDFYTNKKES